MQGGAGISIFVSFVEYSTGMYVQKFVYNNEQVPGNADDVLMFLLYILFLYLISPRVTLVTSTYQCSR